MVTAVAIEPVIAAVPDNPSRIDHMIRDPPCSCVLSWNLPRNFTSSSSWELDISVLKVSSLVLELSAISIILEKNYPLNKIMADIDIDPFGDHGQTDEGPDETTPPVPKERTRVQIHTPDEETSFGGETSLRSRVTSELVKSLYEKLLTIYPNENPSVIHTDLFESRGVELYYKGDNRPLTNGGSLRSTGTIADLLGKKRLSGLGFDIPKGSITPRQAARLNKIEERLPSPDKIENATDIELETMSGDVVNSAEDLISLVKQQSVDHEATQTGDLFEYPMRELLGLDRSLRNIRGSLQDEVAKKVQLEQHIDREKNKLEEMENTPNMTEEQQNEAKERLKGLQNELKGRQEIIDILKGKLNSQIKSIRETITKVLDKETTLGEKIRTLFREQGITIVSVLTAFGMVIGLLVETLTPGGGGSSAGNTKNHENTEGGAREWIKNKLSALGSLLGRLAGAAAASLPGIIGSIVSWILNRAKEVVGWLSQNLWALIVGIGGAVWYFEK
ncbi:uncharacterized protein LOC130647883 [Hydractinia symbiolongicarpus]|uniref:uncharacterized protein LOC130647883 n=1 Tax=Hydractinia symbiolongicarpus TaxID=13093 RepID=UPI00254D270F|nr:uncharacterized protein LOC130647883 [Hydractinia symbiolongicarpus]